MHTCTGATVRAQLSYCWQRIAGTLCGVQLYTGTFCFAYILVRDAVAARGFVCTSNMQFASAAVAEWWPASGVRVACESGGHSLIACTLHVRSSHRM